MRINPCRAMLRAAPVRLWALILAGPPLTLFAAAIVGIIWKGPWPNHLAGDQLTILGRALFIALALIGVIVIALAAVRVKATGVGGASLEVDGDHDGHSVSQTVSATVTREPFHARNAAETDGSARGASGGG